MITEIKAYKCSWCKKVYQIYFYAKAHERKCLHDPWHRACLTCNNLHGIVPGEDDEPRYCVALNFLKPHEKDCEEWAPRSPDYIFWMPKPDKKIQSFRGEEYYIEY